MHSISPPGWRQLDIAVVGGGIGGMSAATAMRRAGHKVSIYERADLIGQAGASISCAANGTRWLHEWGVDVAKGDGVILQKLISRDWTTGKILTEYELNDYEERWGHVYYMFQRQCMHTMLKISALGDGDGVPAKLFLNYKCKNIDLNTGLIEFENGRSVNHDLIVGADGIGSAVRGVLGIRPEKRPAESSCLHANVVTEDAIAAGLPDFSQENALQFWGGHGEIWDKIGERRLHESFLGESDRPVEELLAPYPQLDAQVRGHLALGKEIQPWRLWMHDPYPYIARNMVCLLGDAAHPMMPHQSQAACMAIEDAAALGILFSKKYFMGDIFESLSTYESVRLPRATKVQAAAARASQNINERIGFSSNIDNPVYVVKSERGKLTIEEMNAYDMLMHIDEVVCRRTGEAYPHKYTGGLPIGLRLSNGYTVGDED
ncbi:uncharacterized protein N7446_006531 [Penicillium canescens]|uniref:uncharacterized protein n=1 Tax=Penicillium canescens TaxID=5083 RepID=UPI0026DFB0A3|nr:uncharacterized protein N7446_006531 [Penicillium canescens]KAJ6062411.1 hypothetical protein N7446_006531 [Penicillium canescens]